MRESKSIKSALADARRLVRTLERLTSKRPIADAILEELGEGEILTTRAIALRCRRRRGDVVSVLRAFESAGRIRRVTGGWEKQS